MNPESPMKILPCSAVLCLLACLLPAAPTKVGLVTKDRNLFWSAIETGATDAAKTHDIELLVRAPSMANNVGQQIKLLSSLEKENIKALLIGPLSVEEFKAPIAAFAKAGVKIIAIDTPLPEGSAHIFIGYNQKAVGEATVALFAKRLKDGDELGILRANSVEGISLREKTLANEIKVKLPKSNLHLDIKAGIEKDDDYRQSCLLLEKYPGMKGVITPFSSSTIAMMKAIKDKGLAGKIVHVGIGTGFPAEVEAAIRSGALSGFIAQQPKLMGAKAVEAAEALLSGKAMPPTLDVEFLIITSENVNDPKLAALR